MHQHIQFITNQRALQINSAVNQKNHFHTVMARSHWPMDTTRMHKGHSGRAKFRGWLHFFHPLQKWTKFAKICENRTENNGRG